MRRRFPALLVLAVLAASCGRSAEPGAPSPTPAPPSPTTSVAPAPAYDPTAIASRTPLGDGAVQAVLPASDGSTTVLVTGDLPGDETGCEGMPLQGLLSIGASGDASPVLAADGTPVSDGVRIALPPVPGVDHPVALASTCESFTSRILLGIVGHGGVPTDLVPIGGLGAPDGAPSFETLFDLSFTPDGSTLLAVIGPYVPVGEGGTPSSNLWAYDVATGVWTQRTEAQPGLIAAAAFGTNGLAQIVDDAILYGGHAFAAEGATRIVVAPDGETMAFAGGSGLQVVTPDGNIRTLDESSIGFVGFLPDGSGIVYARVSGNDVTLVVTDLATGVASDLGTSAWGWFAVAPDGSGLAVTVDGAEFGMPAAEFWSFPPAS
ncbi:MAG: hypothetical protein ACKO8G_03280 [Actinomycetota bacterium]